LVHRREATGPNAIWQADHTPLDILLICPDGKTANPWLTVVIDDYSRAVAGYFLSYEAPSALHTSLALRQAIWRKEDSRWTVCGIPDVLYTDNGSDFTSRHLEQVSADLKGEEIPRLCRGGSSSLTFTGVHPRDSLREPTKAHVKENSDGPVGESKPLRMGV
jgi:transposase InsO family protein